MKEKKQTVIRWLIYVVGMIVLAMGVVLNATSGLGASPIVSVAFTLSEGLHFNFGDAALWQYILLVALEFLFKGKKRQWIDLLQIPLALVFTRFMNLFKALFAYESGYLPTDLLVLLLGIVLTGVGAATTVDMNLIPNPGDGFTQSVGMRIGKPLGFAKNVVDVCCVLLSLVLGTILGNTLMGVSLGTVIAMVLVGRVIAVFNHFMRVPLQKAAGIGKSNGK